MKALLTILRKTLVYPFYRDNAGLLFAVLMLAGSFLRAGDHIALAEAAVHSPIMLIGYQALWLLYTLFATRYAVGVIRRNDVLYLFRLVPTPQRWLGLVTVQFLLLNPVLIYTAFVSWISGQQGTVMSTIQLATGYAAMLILPIFWLEHTLRTPNRQPLTARFRGRWHEWFTTPYQLFFIRHLIKNQPVGFFLTKGGTVLLTLGILNLYPTDDYDTRLLLLGALVVAIIHSTIAYRLYQFEHERLALIRNLPIPAQKRLLNYALIFAVVLVPEGVLLVRYQPTGVTLETVLGVWAFGLSVLLLQFTLLLPRHRSIDQLTTLLFSLLLGFFLGIMYRLPGWGLAVFNGLVASVVFFRFYPKSVWITEATD